MHKPLYTFFFCIFLVLGQGVSANTGVVRGGEHDGFTRLTISTEQDVSELKKEEIEPGKFRMVVKPRIAGLDRSEVFARLNAGRVKEVISANNGIEISVNCECELQVSLDGSRLIVIDIAGQSDRETAPLPVLPSDRAALPSPPSLQAAGNDLFALDFSVVDRLHKTIAAQIAQTAHIAGFNHITAPSFQEVRGTDTMAEPLSGDKAETPLQDRCALSRAVWSKIKTAVDTDEPKGFDEVMLADQSSTALAMTEVVHFLSEGQIEEARAAFMSTRPIEVARIQFANFLQMLDGTSNLGSFRFGQCNPLDDLLMAAIRQEVDVPNEIKIELLSTFTSLPLGLQIEVYPRLDWLFTGSSEAFVPGLSLHYVAEAAMAKRIPLEASTKSREGDPDRLAAVSVEMRGTVQETESWQASFQSYLEHHRYFDAVKMLANEPPLSDADKTKTVAQFVEALVANADIATVLEIALSELPEVDRPPSTGELARIAKRLKNEGFADEAASIFSSSSNELSSMSNTTDTSPLESTDALGTSDVPVILPSETLGPEALLTDVWTVSSAQHRVEAAQALRQSVAELLSQ